MRPLWRMLLWCLALALPVQGWAAAAPLHCATAGGPAMPSPAMHVHAVPDAAAHDHHASAHEVAPVNADDDPTGAHTCSACAACSPGIGWPAPGLVVPGAPCGNPALNQAHRAGPSHVPAGPERPPRG